eukprot:3291998-Prymnesium_polylepis.1
MAPGSDPYAERTAACQARRVTSSGVRAGRLCVAPICPFLPNRTRIFGHGLAHIQSVKLGGGANYAISKVNAE